MKLFFKKKISPLINIKKIFFTKSKQQFNNLLFYSIKLIFISLFFFINLKYNETQLTIKKLYYYKHFIRHCFKLNKYYRKYIKTKLPYISICLPVYNMKLYIEKAIISILNQTFQNFEIIIVNDNSNDTTLNIIKKLQSKDDRIKLINHSKNFGVYRSRIDAILLSRGKFLILMDPDDIFLNPNLFQDLINYNLKYNLDIIEFTVISYIEKDNNLTIIKNYYHFHNFTKSIISQPLLDNIHYYDNKSGNLSFKVGCRIIWNKIFRRKTIMKSIEYIGKKYYKKYFITAEDTILNLISFHFAKNYSNINLPGYMYNIREKSMTHGKRRKRHIILFCYNHLLYLKKLYTFIKNFNKNRKIIHNELLDLNKRLIRLNNVTKRRNETIKAFYNEILNDKYSYKNLKDDIKIFMSEIK